MKTNLLSLIFSLLSLLAYEQQGQARREIPTAWIEKLQKYDYRTPANDLVREFQTYIAPDSLDNFYGTISLNSLFANLDTDNDIEIILLIGEQQTKSLCVLDWLEGSYKMIYKQNLLTRYASPSIGLIASNNPSKLFYVEQSFGTTSSFHTQIIVCFYRLIENKVVYCLETNKEFNINQREFISLVSSHLHITSSFDEFENHISVKYAYRFAITNEKGVDNVILEGNAFVSYIWNEDLKKYKASIDDNFSLKQLEALEGKGSFTQAFQEEIKNVEKNGTPEQKEVLKLFFKKN